MLKTFTFLILSLALSAQAAEERTFAMIDGDNAVVKVETDDKEYVQAAYFVDGQEMHHFVAMMLADPTSQLNKLRQEVEMENCGEVSATTDGVPACGVFELTDMVLTSFARGGWENGGAYYTLFAGFRSEGSGHIYDATHMIILSESAQAEVDSDYNYTGTVNKTLTFKKVTRLPPSQ